MRFTCALLLLLFTVDAPRRPEAAIQYFSNVRDVNIAQPDRQNYFTVDEELWMHSRPDLADLRIYDGDAPIQYAISEQRGGISSEEVEAKILNLGSVAGHTEFDLDTQSLPEYDRIHLRLAAHDFVTTASVAGGSTPGKEAEVQLPPSTLYDFTKEQLGSNAQLKLPTSSFRFLHITLSPGIHPQDVKGATIFNLHEQQALWTKSGTCSVPRQQNHQTVVSCTVPERVPISRVEFRVNPTQVNFRRSVSVEDSHGVQTSTGDISRVRVRRGDKLVTNEELSINISVSSGPITLRIDNGDNPPLELATAQPLSIEHRVYFDPQGRALLRLYYGDEKLTAPVYDYARFFHVELATAEAQLGPGAHNPQYAGRPDERPWSERHTAILWTAMLLVVLLLALLAFRGLRTGIAQ